MGGTGFEPATSTMSTSESRIVSDDTKGLTRVAANVCTRVCTSEQDLEQFAADLRDRLTPDECRRLAELLTGGPFNLYSGKPQATPAKSV